MTWDNVLQIAGLILGAITGVGAVHLLEMIKNWLNLSTRPMQALTLGLSFVLAVLNMIVANAIVPGAFEPEALLELTIAVFVATQAEYNRLKRAQITQA